MSKFATLGRRFDLLSVLANNTNWEGLAEDVLQRLIDKPSETGAQFTAFLQNGARMPVADTAPGSSPELSPDPSILAIDYSVTLAEMIAAGRYDWFKSNITAQRFPMESEGAVAYEAMLFHFEEAISSEAAVKKIKTADATNPWKPAGIEHLLAFGAKYPDEQYWYSIVTLGYVDSVHINRSAAYLGSDSANKRCLNLTWWNKVWTSRCRFLAVRKVSRPSGYESQISRLADS
jgi:hypothetical protein